MNTTSRAILQTVLSTDTSLTPAERSGIEQLMNGLVPSLNISTNQGDPDKLLLTQKKAADLLSVNRVTVWRMTKDCVLHPVEILPGTWRYPYRELIDLATRGNRLAPKSAESVATAA